MKSILFSLFILIIFQLSFAGDNPDKSPDVNNDETASESSEDFEKQVPNINWGHRDSNIVLEAVNVLPDEFLNAFDAYITFWKLNKINYTDRNAQLRLQVAEENPGMEDDLDYLIERIIVESSHDAALYGFVGGGLSEAFISRFLGKSASEIGEKYKSILGALGKGAAFASVTVFLTTRYFLDAYFQIANLLGWVKGNTITDEDNRRFLAQAFVYSASLYTTDVSLALIFRGIGKAILRTMPKHGFTDMSEEALAQMEELGQSHYGRATREMLEDSGRFSVRKSKEVLAKYFKRFVGELDVAQPVAKYSFWREFFGMLFRTVGMNKGAKNRFLLDCAVNKSEVSQGNSFLAKSLAAQSFSPFHIAAHGTISALSSWALTKYSLAAFIRFLEPSHHIEIVKGHTDFGSLIENEVFFKFLVNAIAANKENPQGLHSRGIRISIEDMFATVYREIYDFGDDGFIRSPFYQAYALKIQNREPMAFTQKELDFYYSTNIETKKIVYLLCYYFLAYDGFSQSGLTQDQIGDDKTLASVTFFDEMRKSGILKDNEALLFNIKRDEFAKFLQNQRKDFSRDPASYAQDPEKAAYPELVALRWLKINLTANDVFTRSAPLSVDLKPASPLTNNLSIENASEAKE
ncbi:MAG: hypothetical protein HYS98_08605 [Deltaproteobacteria bacterium]|nr:hypothetical protein [Deltaproteobacteria bacterium]